MTVLTMAAETAAHAGQGEQVEDNEQQWARMLARPEVVVLVAERDGTPAGYVSAVRGLQLREAGDILRLDHLFVRDGYRHSGVGRLLMLELARVAQPEEVIIRGEMQEDDVAAQRFYRRLGASLRTEMIAAWTPEQQAEFLHQAS